MNPLVIVGAGLAGIEIAKKHPGSIVLEKSRGIGGRLASRRLGDASINHGPQNLMIDDQIINDPHQWIKGQTQELNILKTFEVSMLEILHDKIRVKDKTGEYIDAEKIILTVPAPQAKNILENSKLNADFLERAKYKSDIQFMLLGSRLHFNSLLSHFDLVTCKVLAKDQNLYLFTMKDRYVKDFIDQEKDEIKNYCLERVNGEIIDSHLHKWRYSEVISAIDSHYQLHFLDQKILLAGDYFGLNGVESTRISVENIIPFI